MASFEDLLVQAQCQNNFVIMDNIESIYGTSAKKSMQTQF